jgi:hypothetical protein
MDQRRALAFILCTVTLAVLAFGGELGDRQRRPR